MNLLELKEKVDNAIEYANECQEKPSDIVVSLQIDGPGTETVYSSDVDLHYDNNLQASGCVLTAFRFSS